MPGVFQIDVQIPQSLQPGNNVPITVTVGGATTQAGVTLAVQ
jgi:uncharacterized protein (TIGR03437 family)